MMKLTIFLVEDTQGDAVLFEEALNDISDDFDIIFDLTVARSLAEAKKVIQDDETSFDVIFLDLGLPDAVEHSGLDAIMEHAPQVPIIVLTGHQDISRSVEYIERGASDYLLKTQLNADNLYRATRYAIERKKSAVELTRLARTDPLTQLSNRRVFEQAVTSASENAARTEMISAVLVCDLDEFKYVNDKYGHQVGDELLCQISQRLTATLRKTDVVARLGGDEFGILLLNLPTSEGALQASEKIFEAVTDSAYFVNSLELFVNFSIGFTLIGHDNLPATTIIARADSAMFKAKKTDDVSIKMFDDSLKSEERSTFKLKKSMAADFDKNNFLVHYQPIVDAKSHEIVGVEALARWKDHTGKFVPPAIFIPVAEQTNLIDGITVFNLKRICKDIIRWRNLGFSAPHISVNLSPLQLRDSAFVEHFVRAITQSGLEPELFQVEIFETAALHDFDVVYDIIAAFQAHGIKVYIDDFGAGASSFSILRELPIDGIKIDKSFVRNLGQNSRNLQILEGIIKIAEAIKITTVVEGIETEELSRTVAALGANQMQGFYFATPMLGSSFSRHLAAATPSRFQFSAEM